MSIDQMANAIFNVMIIKRLSVWNVYKRKKKKMCCCGILDSDFQNTHYTETTENLMQILLYISASFLHKFSVTSILSAGWFSAL